jgi:hypothetical protein
MARRSAADSPAALARPPLDAPTFDKATAAALRLSDPVNDRSGGLAAPNDLRDELLCIPGVQTFDTFPRELCALVCAMLLVRTGRQGAPCRLAESSCRFFSLHHDPIGVLVNGRATVTQDFRTCLRSSLRGVIF